MVRMNSKASEVRLVLNRMGLAVEPMDLILTNGCTVGLTAVVSFPCIAHPMRMLVPWCLWSKP